ncbi:MAG TPA: patatin-like phospholipase family protein, partial [Polyangiaceae bacterium]|nr:patatin-like phospholipase family protein [Polyangiaceae bacterium]
MEGAALAAAETSSKPYDEPGGEMHRSWMFGWMFAVLVRKDPGRLFDSTADDEKGIRTIAFRTLALIADTLVLHVRDDIADRLELASELFLRGDEPRLEAARLFCRQAKTAGGYRALYEERQTLAGGGGALIDWAVRVLKKAASPRDSCGNLVRLKETLNQLLLNPPSTVSSTIRAPSLYRLESTFFYDDGARLDDACVPSPLTTREPGVAFPARDYLGLALSGGGIRSATFNLGLLQALQEKGVLEHVKYLSTVSGGGYIGGFWSAWRARYPGAPFPSWSSDAFTEGSEHPAVRHLREYSRFLIPRVGFGQLETWNAVVATLGGILVSVPVMTAAVATVYWIALFVLCGLSCASHGPGDIWGALAFGWLNFLGNMIAERRLSATGKLG